MIANYHQLHAHVGHTIQVFGGAARRHGYYDEVMVECTECNVVLLYHETTDHPELDVLPCANCGEDVWSKEPGEHVRTMRVDCDKRHVDDARCANPFCPCQTDPEVRP